MILLYMHVYTYFHLSICLPVNACSSVDDMEVQIILKCTRHQMLNVEMQGIEKQKEDVVKLNLQYLDLNQ